LNVLKDNITAKNRKPQQQIASVKTNLFDLDSKENVLVWFGHSSYFIQLNGKRILVDPVFSGFASPFSFSIKAFNGADIYKPEDIPEIDYLVITHDHWDHLDYKTIKKLQPKIEKIVTGLGVGEHFEYWGFEKEKIIELDWFEKFDFQNGFVFYGLPARHFSGRGFSPKKTLWLSFLLETPSQKIFIGGDGGYDSHFAKIGEKFGEIDLAILENGQYNQAWKYIHMMPEEVLQASTDLNAKRLLPVHHSKFALSIHSWNEPLNKISALNESENIPLLTPKIGEKVILDNSSQKFTEWWKQMN
jgi:L-ascorbate metabolism protein UlaG (beta-lactamase superfamily)